MKRSDKIFLAVEKACYLCTGGMAERSNAPVLKTGDPSRGPGVRIPLPPQSNYWAIAPAMAFYLEKVNL